MLQNLCASTLQYNYKLRLQRYRPDLPTRLLLLGKQYLNFHTLMTSDTAEKRASKMMLRFFRAFNARRTL